MIESVLSTSEAANASTALPKLLGSLPMDEPIRPFLEVTRKALASGDWSEVGPLFQTGQFLDQDGGFWIAGPYSVLRGGKRQTRETTIFGRSLEATSPRHLTELASRMFQRKCEDTSTLLAVEVHAASGFAGSEEGEAFLVPDGWGFPGSSSGPALNDMREQRARFLMAGQICIQRIFDEDTADLLIAAMNQAEPWYSIQHREFTYHEVGHTTGIGLKQKLNSGLLATPWYRAVEEWRSDGVSFDLLEQTLSLEEAGKVIAANLVLRFGIDAQRAGGMDRDTEVNASVLTFDRLLSSGALRLGKNRRLRFNAPGYPGLVAAIQSHRQDAVQLTKDEISLRHPEGIWGLYGSVHVSRASRHLFQDLITEPCSGTFEKLA